MGTLSSYDESTGEENHMLYQRIYPGRMLAWEDLIEAFQYLKEAWKQDGEQLFTFFLWPDSNRTRVN